MNVNDVKDRGCNMADERICVVVSHEEFLARRAARGIRAAGPVNSPSVEEHHAEEQYAEERVLGPLLEEIQARVRDDSDLPADGIEPHRTAGRRK